MLEVEGEMTGLLNGGSEDNNVWINHSAKCEGPESTDIAACQDSVETLHIVGLG